ncbi:MAG: helix-turn-helix domain-containing protein [Myxococcota bacterium]
MATRSASASASAGGTPATTTGRGARRPSARARARLTRDGIAEAGARLAREHDLRSLTMQSVGDALGVTAMALYKHFASKAELVDAVLDRFVADAAVTAHGVAPSDWKAWMAATFGAMHRALALTPGVLSYVAIGDEVRFGDRARDALRESLAVLRAAGFTKAEARHAYRSALALAVGYAFVDRQVEPARAASAFDRALRQYLAGLERAR